MALNPSNSSNLEQLALKGLMILSSFIALSVHRMSEIIIPPLKLRPYGGIEMCIIIIIIIIIIILCCRYADAASGDHDNAMRRSNRQLLR